MFALVYRHIRWVKIFVAGALAALLAGAWVLRRMAADLPPISSLDTYTPSLVTKIFDVHGQLITELYVERRTVLALGDIPEPMRRAAVAVEDDVFYDHPGVDVKGILRAMLSNLRAGKMVQGGSTITQQLAKNIFLTQERTLARKIKELLLTLQIEKNFSKDEIFQFYLNQIYFGHGAYGVESAARVFFGKRAADLTLGECALLAGLTRNPQYYSPFRNLPRAIRRRNVVLRRMRELGMISDRDVLAAQKGNAVFSRTPRTDAVASYFVEAVRLELEPAFGAEALYREGLTIDTTLDLRLQRAAETAGEKRLAGFDKQYGEQRLLYLLKTKKITPAYYAKWKKAQHRRDKEKEDEEEFDEPLKVQGALVAMDPQTGGIRALVGGRDFQKSQFNRALQAKRQPGSTFKPFVWLAALESGYTAATVVDDLPIAYTDVARHPRLAAEATDYASLRDMVTGYYTPEYDPEKDPDPIWAPQNWDNKFLGPVTLRRGLALSRNLVSVRLIDRVGPRAVMDMAQKAGIESPLDPVLSLGLGSSVVTLKEMTTAFATFAAGGVRPAPFMVAKVVDRHGKVLLEHIPQTQAVISPQSNYLLTRLLQAVVQEGTGGYAASLHRPLAGKTGTTQDIRDAWFLGFAPDLAAGVWVGYDDFVPLGKNVSSAVVAVPWWTDFMAEAGKTIPVRDFPVPSGVTFAKIDRDAGLLALPGCPRVVLEAFRAGAAPTEYCAVDHDAESGAADVEIVE
jgi:penicillin-binding protein 1A